MLFFFIWEQTLYTAYKVSKYGVFSGPNTGEYGPEKTPYLVIFHAAIRTTRLKLIKIKKLK